MIQSTTVQSVIDAGNPYDLGLPAEEEAAAVEAYSAALAGRLADGFDGLTQMGDRVVVASTDGARVWTGFTKAGRVADESAYDGKLYIHVAYDEGWTGEVQSTDVAEGLRLFRVVPE